MADNKENRTVSGTLIVEFVGPSINLKRVGGGPIFNITHQEWHDIKMGKYDPPKKEKPAPE